MTANLILVGFALPCLDKELLSVGSNLSACSGFNQFLYFLPVLSERFETLKESLVLLSGPSTSSFTLAGHSVGSFRLEFEFII
jgi:hypothetical protein